MKKIRKGLCCLIPLSPIYVIYDLIKTNRIQEKYGLLIKSLLLTLFWIVAFGWVIYKLYSVRNLVEVDVSIIYWIIAFIVYGVNFGLSFSLLKLQKKI